jgi:hypothetical protein
LKHTREFELVSCSVMAIPPFAGVTRHVSSGHETISTASFQLISSWFDGDNLLSVATAKQ